MRVCELSQWRPAGWFVCDRPFVACADQRTAGRPGSGRQARGGARGGARRSHPLSADPAHRQLRLFRAVLTDPR
ncbi:hypothetical protein GCM10010442_09930 [Kitasatospora kifunensis]